MIEYGWSISITSHHTIYKITNNHKLDVSSIIVNQRGSKLLQLEVVGHGHVLSYPQWKLALVQVLRQDVSTG